MLLGLPDAASYEYASGRKHAKTVIVERGMYRCDVRVMASTAAAGVRVVLDRQARAQRAADPFTRGWLEALVRRGRVTLVATDGDDLAARAAAADALVAGSSSKRWPTTIVATGSRVRDPIAQHIHQLGIARPGHAQQQLEVPRVELHAFGPCRAQRVAAEALEQGRVSGGTVEELLEFRGRLLAYRSLLARCAASVG